MEYLSSHMWENDYICFYLVKIRLFRLVYPATGISQGLHYLVNNTGWSSGSSIRHYNYIAIFCAIWSSSTLLNLEAYRHAKYCRNILSYDYMNVIKYLEYFYLVS